LLAGNPELGERRTTRRFGACRCFTCGNFVIFFRGVPDGAEIIRIVRGERDLEQI
jgi:plasmid stabilization system protein ParE